MPHHDGNWEKLIKEYQTAFKLFKRPVTIPAAESPRAAAQTKIAHTTASAIQKFVPDMHARQTFSVLGAQLAPRDLAEVKSLNENYKNLIKLS